MKSDISDFFTKSFRPFQQFLFKFYRRKVTLCTKIYLRLFNNQPDASIIQIYSVIKLHMFRASSLPIVRSFLLYIRHW